MEYLNNEQKIAVQHTEGPLLVIAGAGSGKTRIIVERIANIIKQNLAFPNEIIAVTFTNKASRELKVKLQQKIGNDGQHIVSGTFHSICARILRINASLLGYSSNFAIYDNKDTLKIIKQIVKKKNISLLQYPIKKIIRDISNAKNKLIYPDNFRIEMTSDLNQETLEIFEDYQHELTSSNAFDFDDLIAKTITMLSENNNILQYYQNKFKYIHVDEYQDINYAQDKLIKLLSGLYNNICVVGDEDQSIYSWRGSDVNNILNFENRYTDCKVIFLEKNYRSTKNILEFANNVIAVNKNRLGKKLYTNLEDGELIHLYSSKSAYEESEKVIKIISHLISKQVALKKIAILYRLNSQSRILEEKLLKMNYPYSIIGGQKFYERKEIKNILSYLRLIFNSYDNLSLERIINFPPRGIGKKTIAILKQHAQEHNITLFSTLKKVASLQGITSKAQNSIKKFIHLIEDTQELLMSQDVLEIVEKVCKESNLLEYYKNHSDNGHNYFENIQEFVRGVENFTNSNPQNKLADYLESVSLLTSADTENNNDNQLTLMTAHIAKGMEYDNIIIIGINNGIFPINREDSDLEEERRLFYVALTRAKKRLYLSCFSKQNNLNSQYQSYTPSIFLDNLTKETCDFSNYNPEYDSNNDEKRYTSFFPQNKKKYRHNFIEGDWVISPQLGEGKILNFENNNENAIIDFDDFGIKELIIKYAKLKKKEY